MILNICGGCFHFYCTTGWPTRGLQVNILGFWAIWSLLKLLNSATEEGVWLCSIKFYLLTLKFEFHITKHYSFDFFQPFEFVKSFLSFLGSTKTDARFNLDWRLQFSDPCSRATLKNSIAMSNIPPLSTWNVASPN